MTVSIDAYKSIEGWLTDNEARALQEFAKGRNVLEVGTWKGKSAIAMAATAKNVFTLDHFQGDGYTGKAYTYKEAMDNVRVSGADNIVVIAGDMYRTVGFLDFDREFDCVYYDSDHTEEAVWRMLPPFMRTGKPIAFHDYERIQVYIKGVEAFDVLCARYGYEIKIVDRLAIASTNNPDLKKYSTL